MERGSDQDLDWLRLARSPRVGPATFRRLIGRFGTAQQALEALPELSKRGGAPLQPAEAAQVEAELRAGEALGARLLRLGGPNYPTLLNEIHDAPAALWALGDPSKIGGQSVAIVGSRTATANGTRFGRWLGEALTEAGWLIASGLARGIDAAAHRGALEKGATAAVVAGGVDDIYPRENAALREAIIEKGVVLSEMPMGFAPQARHFPRRNRIVSGLSRGVVVIEAAERSGSLITARLALEQNREVMAAPGHPLDARAAGGNKLIREGATLIRGPEDVIEALSQPFRRRMPAQGSLFEAAPQAETHPDLPERLAALLSFEAAAFDELVRALNAPPGEVSAALLDLELAGRAETHPGGGVSLVVNTSATEV